MSVPKVITGLKIIINNKQVLTNKFKDLPKIHTDDTSTTFIQVLINLLEFDIIVLTMFVKELQNQ